MFALTSLALSASPLRPSRRTLWIPISAILFLSAFLPTRNIAVSAAAYQAAKLDHQQPNWVHEIEPGVVTIGQSNPWANLHNICTSPDGKLIAGQDNLNQVVVVRAEDRKTLGAQRIEQGQVTSLTFSPKGDRLAIVIFDVRDRTNEVAEDEDSDLAKQPARNFLLVLDENFSPQLDMPIPPFRYGTRESGTLVDIIRNCSFSESGDLLLLTGPGGPRAVDLKTKELIYYTAENLMENGFFISNSLVYFPRRAAVWDIWKNRLETSDRFLPLKQSQVIDVHPESGYVLAARSSEVFLFHLKNQNRKTLTEKNQYSQSWQLSGDAKKVAGVITSGAGTEIGIWDVVSGTQQHTCILPKLDFANFGFLNDGQQLIAECYSGSQHHVAIVNLDSDFKDNLLTQPSSLPITKNVEIGNNNRWAVIDNGRLLVDLEDGQQSEILPLDFAGNSQCSVEVAMNSTGAQLVHLTSDFQVASLTSTSIKDLSEKPKTRSYKIRSKENQSANLILGMLGGQPTYDSLYPLAVAFDPQLQQALCLLHGTSSGTRLIKYDFQAETIVTDFTLESKAEVDMGQNALASFSGDGTKFVYATVSDWVIVEVESRQATKISRNGHDVAQLNQAGTTLATGKAVQKGSSFCRDARIVDVNRNQIVRQFGDTPISFSFARENDQMLVVDAQGRGELIQMPEAKTIRELGPTQAPPTAAQISSDGKQAVIGLADSRLEIWRISETSKSSSR